MSLGPGHVLRDRVSIVLVEPQHPGNVGSAARAMKNMGLRKLVVVAPASFDLERARWMGSGAHDVLLSARYVATVDEALEGCTWAVGSTARSRRWRWPVMNPDQVAAHAFEPGLHDGLPPRTAVLFGREDMGLSNEALERCQAILRFTTDGASSINLAQAVLLACEAFRRAGAARGWDGDERRLTEPQDPGATAPIGGPERPATATLANQSRVVNQVLGVLHGTSYMLGKTDAQVSVLLSTLLQRAQPTDQELNVIRGMLRKTRWSLEHGTSPEPPDGAD